MNATERLDSTHQEVLESVEDLPESEWEVPGVCGSWSVKDVIAHLTAYELVLLDALNTLAGEEPTPYLLRFVTAREDFNRAAIAARRYQTAQQVLTEYQDIQVRTTSLLAQQPTGRIEQQESLPWYDTKSSMADLLATLSAHAHEHCTQIRLFREKDEQHQ